MAVVRRRVLLGFVSVLVLRLISAATLHFANKNLHATRIRVDAAQTDLDALHSYFSSVQRSEIERRTYLITGDGSHLDSYNRAASEVEYRWKNVEVLLANGSPPLSTLERLRRLNQEEANESDSYLRGTKASGVLSGSTRLDAIQALVADLQESQNQALQRGRRQYEMAIAQRDRLFAETFAAELALLGFVFVATYRDTVYRARSAFCVLQGNLRLTAILKTMSEGLYQVDRKGKLVYLNPAGEDLLGYKKDEIAGKTMHDIVHGTSDGNNLCNTRDCALITFPADGTSQHRSNALFRRNDGSCITVEYTWSSLFQYGQSNGAVLVFRDVTERNQMELALRDSETRYRNLVEKSRGLIYTHAMDGTLHTVNEASAESLGYSPAELEGKNLRELVAPAFHEKLDWYLQAVCEWGTHSGFMRVVTKDGNEIVWSYSNRVIHNAGSPPYVLGNAHDVTAQVLAEEALKNNEDRLQAALEVEKNISRLDFLTSIPNRRTFYEVVESEVQRARRYRRPMTLVYIDVDNFKSVNDELGHAAGDALLKLVAETIQTTIRRTDTPARLGGDEFALVLPETNADAAGVVLTKLQTRLQEVVHHHRWPVSFSIGTVTFASPQESVDDMIKRADELMYRVKRNGKSAVICETV
jgi:diguanylate cyclase (GGDEF)-like protein/PAS domain S-box-containing protein